ncbi:MULTISPECIES: carbohydrate ABC transporter permease [unclassified Devosia]|jgi:multiple sugar transport system permease protein|uniref:carbohydrate ABC transporter permease n=1 Tax=unclassified Devosia TaxID=196773 RepID=UPI00086E7EF4|nr:MULTISPECIES: carbohydrate ABC transporter permease [unclassified Devosia]MBN9364820.1 carbohydrate ABC transporter permease [Devosia sp.]ODS81131.1 MAG: sugar ABC transporter permease [Devosia sp. SCN 66-27]OJX25665.1 MAG: sugar ABC transporter permease [Devosia sp. 66-14]
MGKTATDWVLFVVLLIGALLMSGPFVWMIATSFKPAADVFQFPPTLFTADPQVENYVRIFTTIPFGRAMANSLVVSVLVTLLQLITCSMAAYAFACLRFRGREALFLIYLAALMVPSQVTLIPNFILIKTLGWIDTYQGLILPYAFSSFGTFLLRQYLKSIPAELLEAARIDGASHAQIYLTIVLPLAKPALGALAIFTFVAQWNNFLWPLITTTKPDMQVAIVALATLQGQYNTDWPLLMTGSVIAIVPVLLVFVFGNRAFIAGLTTGAFGGR